MMSGNKWLLGLNKDSGTVRGVSQTHILTDSSGVSVDCDRVFESKDALFEFVAREAASRPDICISLLGTAASNSRLVAKIFQELFSSAVTHCSLSFLQVEASSLQVNDLFGSTAAAGKTGTGAASVVTGIKVSTAAQTMEALQRFGPSVMTPGRQTVLTATRTVGNGVKHRMHLAFGGANVWEEACAFSPENLLSKLAARCTCIRLVTASQMEFAQEWRRLFPKSESRRLADAERRIQELEEQLAESQRRLAIRENTLINVLISTHPAFEGLADYPRRPEKQAKVGDKENTRNIVWDSSVVDNVEAPLKSSSAVKSKKPQQMLRSLSNGSTPGAARVTKSSAVLSATPGPTPSRAAAGRTPGAVKSRSRVF